MISPCHLPKSGIVQTEIETVFKKICWLIVLTDRKKKKKN